MFWLARLGFILLLVLCAGGSFGQTLAENEARLAELQRQIAEEQRRLRQTTEREQVSLRTLQQVEREIATREALVRTQTRSLSQYNARRDSLEREVGVLQSRASALRQEYIQYAIHAYKRGRINDLALLFSAESFPQMIRRARYLRRFAAHRKQQLAELERTQAQLVLRRTRLEETRQTSLRVLAESQSEQERLLRLRGERETVVAALRRERTSLDAEIRRKQEAARNLQRQIQALIAEETVVRENRADPVETAAVVALSGTFAQNRGRLPWPASGVVQEPFGNVVNPVYGTVTPNPGILVATSPGAPVEAVFEGRISRVDVMPEYGTYILIQHGNFHTLYANLSSVSVRQGDTVAQGRVIGRAGQDESPRGAGVFFGVFQSGREQDPAQWLRRR